MENKWRDKTLQLLVGEMKRVEIDEQRSVGGMEVANAPIPQALDSVK